MDEVKDVIDEFEELGSYTEKAQVAALLLMMCKQHGKEMTKQSLSEVSKFAVTEIERLIDVIPATTDYKAVDTIFEYADRLLALYTFANAEPFDMGASDVGVIKTLIGMVEKRRTLENAIDDAFKAERINAEAVKKFLDIARAAEDEYFKSKVYSGLLYYGSKISAFDKEARALMSEYILSEFARYTEHAQTLTDDEAGCLEIAADACRFFMDDKMAAATEKLLGVPRNNVRFFAADTLICCGRDVDGKVIEELAADLVYAELLYSSLKSHGKAGLFPQRFASKEYLAKSDLTHWLVYPTELGKAPDAIEYLGKVGVKFKPYYIFKFMSDSDNLSDEDKNVWLVGWSASGGNTFSRFDKLSDFDKGDIKKTLKNIKAKQLK
ncbi:MAG: hypothetical protein NC184_06515 [Roseburia sp.]|nr:hypothetical protein [Roseburia sp.]